jgi:hypothetical protein
MDVDENDHVAAVVTRTVNGEQTWSAWFPNLPATTYGVYVRDDYANPKWVTVYAGEVAELDWRTG